MEVVLLLQVRKGNYISTEGKDYTQWPLQGLLPLSQFLLQFVSMDLFLVERRLVEIDRMQY